MTTTQLTESANQLSMPWLAVAKHCCGCTLRGALNLPSERASLSKNKFKQVPLHARARPLPKGVDTPLPFPNGGGALAKEETARVAQHADDGQRSMRLDRKGHTQTTLVTRDHVESTNDIDWALPQLPHSPLWYTQFEALWSVAFLMERESRTD